jgi:glycosyltransferase involved in cell wall biosynthesis
MFDRNSLRRKWLKKQLYGRLVEWPQVRAAAAMVYTHEEERRLAEESVRGLPKGFIVPLGADAPPDAPLEHLRLDFLRRFPHLQRKRIVLFLSRVHPKKGLDLLIPAFRNVAARCKDAHLVIVGSGDPEYLSTLHRTVDRLRISDCVTFTGSLNGRSKWEAMAAATMLVLPSYQENFGLVVAEAMQLGVPVVLSRHVNTWTDVVQGGAGLVCELSCESVATAIFWLLEDASRPEAIGRRGKALAVERFNWNGTAVSMASVYTAVLQNDSGNWH